MRVWERVDEEAHDLGTLGPGDAEAFLRLTERVGLTEDELLRLVLELALEGATTLKRRGRGLNVGRPGFLRLALEAGNQRFR